MRSHDFPAWSDNPFNRALTRALTETIRILGEELPKKEQA